MRLSETSLDQAVVREQRAWSSPESIEYYRHHRQVIDELYPSERFFLPDIACRVESMLDVGCAAGGFSEIVRNLNPRIRYFGVDIVPAFIETARTEHPHADFALGDGLTFSTSPETFDLVHASGVLHLNLRYREMLNAMWRQTRRFLLCDFRLTTGAPEIGCLRSPFGEREPVSLPYVVISVAEMKEIFAGLDPAPVRVHAKGYPHRASPSAELRSSDIVTAFVLAEKAHPSGAPVFEIDLNAGSTPFDT